MSSKKAVIGLSAVIALLTGVIIGDARLIKEYKKRDKLMDESIDLLDQYRELVTSKEEAN